MPTTPNLLERDAELASIDALIGEARDGEAHLALVEGPAGIGKSRLLAELRRRAQSEGFRVLTARGSEIEREFPFGVARQLFEPLIANEGSREELLAGSAAPAAAVFSSSEEPPSGDSSFAVLNGLYWLAVNLSERQPLLLAVDDLHWADASSLRYIAYLARRLEGVEMLVAMTQRSADPGADPALLAEIANDPLTVAIQPRPLTAGAVAEMVRERLGEEAVPAFCEACHETTGGNPLLLEELLRTLASERIAPGAENVKLVKDLGPRAASRSVLIRLARLDPDAVAVARATAVLGDGAELGTVAELAGLSVDRAAEMSGALARAEILRPEAPLGFVHPLVRAAVYADLPPGERELRHQQAAQQLRDAGAPAEQVAAHLLAIPPKRDERAAKVLHRAGREATVKGASDSAAAYLRRALEEPPDPESRTRIVFELGLVESLTNAPASVEHLREAYYRLDEPVAKGLAASMLARGLLMSGRQAEAAELAERATQELPPELTDMRAAMDSFQGIAALFGIGDYDKARQRMRGYSEMDPSSLGWKFVSSLDSLDRTYRALPADECCALAIRALDGGDLIRADSGLTVFGAINTLVFADRPEADRYWAELQAESHQRGSLFAISGLHMWQGHALARRGELSDAEEMLQEANDEFSLYGYGAGAHVYLRAFLGACRLDRGDVQGARRLLEGAKDPGDSSDAAGFWLYAKIRILLAEGRDEEVIEVADELARRRGEVVNPAIFRWRNPKAIALHRLGRTEEGLPLAREEVEIARGYGGPTALGHSLRVLGQLVGGDEGMELLRESVEVLDGSLARLELAESLCALGTAVRLARKPSDAREPLSRALEIAGVCGAEQVVERARSELYATGARPRRDALKGVESLTPSERRVADLAAAGNSNREIAQELYVTPKTVEVHLSNAYRKLEIKGRRELAGVLGAPTAA